MTEKLVLTCFLVMIFASVVCRNEEHVIVLCVSYLGTLDKQDDICLCICDV
jgi:hypothetical protein